MTPILLYLIEKTSIINLSISITLSEINRKGEKIMLFSPKEKGQGLVEYALILVLVAVVVIVVMQILGPTVGNVFSSIISSLTAVSGG